MKGIEQTKVAVQGAGNVGANFARFAQEAGFKGVAVSFYEWLQNKKQEKWSKNEVFKRLKKSIPMGALFCLGIL